jgi:hypothetical protein
MRPRIWELIRDWTKTVEEIEKEDAEFNNNVWRFFPGFMNWLEGRTKRTYICVCKGGEKGA